MREAIMHEYFCGPTSFALLRIPPQAKQVLPPFPHCETPLDRRTITTRGLESFWPQPPLHTLTTSRVPGTRSMAIIEHTLIRELPPGSFQIDDDLGLTYASPQCTLLTMAPLISLNKLTMAMYELCGSFAVFDPGPELQSHLDAIEPRRLIWPGNWRQVRSQSGQGTSLWRREPLVSIGELERYRDATKGMRGNNAFAKALSLVTGICASPLEVQASMLLALPACRGGEGLHGFKNNCQISLTPTAMTLAGQNTCYADLYFDSVKPRPGKPRPGIVIECQGRVVHENARQGSIDANRTLALQNMGLEVMLVTREQLRDKRRFDAFTQHLREKLGVRKRTRSARSLQATEALRQDLFEDWETFYLPDRDINYLDDARRARARRRKGQGGCA